MTILVVYSQEPDFPPTDQNPSAKRAYIGAYVVDYLAPAPTEEEVEEYVSPTPAKQILGPISAATLGIEAGEVSGIETSLNFAVAFPIDIDTYWIMFTAPEPDTDYLVLGNVPFVRNTDFIEFVAPDHSEVSLTTWRVSN